jgi:hypothetical protein
MAIEADKVLDGSIDHRKDKGTIAISSVTAGATISADTTLRHRRSNKTPVMT